MKRLRFRTRTAKIIFFFLIILTIYLTIGIVNSLHYKKGVYDCRFYSRDTEDILESVGFSVQIVTGDSTDGNGHCWTRINGIDFEPICLMPGFLNNIYFNKNIHVYNDYSDYEHHWGLK